LKYVIKRNIIRLDNKKRGGQMELRDAPIIRGICFLVAERKCDFIYVNEFGSVFGFKNYGAPYLGDDMGEWVRMLDSFDMSDEDIRLDGVMPIGLDHHSDGTVYFHPMIESLIPSINEQVQIILDKEYKNINVEIELCKDNRDIKGRVLNALAMGRGYMLPNYLSQLLF
jgi:hypothetical protein